MSGIRKVSVTERFAQKALAESGTRSVPVAWQTLGALQHYRDSLYGEAGRLYDRKEVLQSALDVAQTLLAEEKSGQHLVLGLEDNGKGGLRPRFMTLAGLYAEAAQNAGPLLTTIGARLGNTLVEKMETFGEALQHHGVLSSPDSSSVMNYTLLMADHLVRKMKEEDCRICVFHGIYPQTLVSWGGQSLRRDISYRSPSLHELTSMTPR